MTATVTKLRRAYDGLRNLLSGVGTEKDKRAHWKHVWIPLTMDEIEAMYASDWLAAKIIDIIPSDMTREWREWEAKQAEDLYREEKVLCLRSKVRQALIRARMYGGAAILIGDGTRDPRQPLVYDTFPRGGIKYLHVFSQHELSPGDTVKDINSKDYGKPEFYRININTGLMVEQPVIHRSRFAFFTGVPASHLSVSLPSDNGWGISVLDRVGAAVTSANATAMNAAALTEEAKVDMIMVPDLHHHLATPEGTNLLKERFAIANTMKSTVNMLLLGGDEKFERKQISFSGLPELMRSQLEIAAGAADVPLTRLLGTSPGGLNATGESDIRNYYDNVRSKQTNELEEELEPLDECFIRHVLGRKPDSVVYTWVPLWQLTEVEEAALWNAKMDAFGKVNGTNLFDQSELRQPLADMIISGGWLPFLDQYLLDETEFENLLLERQEQEMAQLAAFNETGEGAEQLALPAPAQGGDNSQRFIETGEGLQFDHALDHRPGGKEHNQKVHGKKGSGKALTPHSEHKEEKKPVKLQKMSVRPEKLREAELKAPLTEQEESAILSYSSSAGWVMNANLRGTSPQKYQGMDQEVALLDSALSKASLPEELTVSRYMSERVYNQLKTNDGKTFTDKAFVSTSHSDKIDDESASSFAGKPQKHAIIVLPKGTRALHIGDKTINNTDIGEFSPEEQLELLSEVLIARNTTFKVDASGERLVLRVVKSDKAKDARARPFDADDPEFEAKHPRGWGGRFVDKDEAEKLLREATAKDPTPSEEEFLDTLEPEELAKLVDAFAKEKSAVPTTANVKDGGYMRDDGTYTEERQQVHQRILKSIFTRRAVAEATPLKGVNPQFTLLGGRGGSGKSWLFEGGEEAPVDKDHAIYLNSDDIKAALPEYKGWNAAILHEESNHILLQAEATVKKLRLNAILDATMRSTKWDQKRIEEYKALGYDINAHYMFASPRVAATRAVKRFLKTGRLVTPAYTLGSDTNEKTFDIVRQHATEWTLYSSDDGFPPKFIAGGGNRPRKDPRSMSAFERFSSRSGMITSMSVGGRKAI